MRITWFNPPYDMWVKTDVARIFLLLIDKHFPSGHILHSTINRTTIRVSYKCMPSLGAIIARHNSKILKGAEGVQQKRQSDCNCQISKREKCPVPGECDSLGVVYQASVTNDQGRKETYVGLAKSFKPRFRSHTSSLKTKKEGGDTTLANYFWEEKEAGRNPIVRWRFLDKGLTDFDPVKQECTLCMREKYFIVLESGMATLNSRQEVFGACRHKAAKRLAKPPED